MIISGGKDGYLRASFSDQVNSKSKRKLHLSQRGKKLWIQFCCSCCPHGISPSDFWRMTARQVDMWSRRTCRACANWRWDRLGLSQNRYRRWGGLRRWTPWIRGGWRILGARRFSRHTWCLPDNRMDRPARRKTPWCSSGVHCTLMDDQKHYSSNEEGMEWSRIWSVIPRSCLLFMATIN